MVGWRGLWRRRLWHHDNGGIDINQHDDRLVYDDEFNDLIDRAVNHYVHYDPDDYEYVNFDNDDPDDDGAEQEGLRL
jgi:hypothetical protein